MFLLNPFDIEICKKVLFKVQNDWGSDLYPKDGVWSPSPTSQVLACVNGVDWHRDESFPPWSALLCLDNWGLTLEDRSGKLESVTPATGQVVLINIHAVHRAVNNNALIEPNRKVSAVWLYADFENKPKEKAVKLTLEKVIEKYL